MILLPMVLIVLQRETGSALVYLAFFLMLYREGMPGSILFTGICAVVYFVVGIRFGQDLMPDECTPIGEFAVLSLVTLLVAGLIRAYCHNVVVLRNVLLYGVGSILLCFLFSLFVIPFNVLWFLYLECGALVCYLLWLSFRERAMNYFYIAVFALGSVAFLYSADYVFNEVLQPHQRTRIEVLLGMEEDLAGAGYNVNQSKIAIGSGGLLGKGFLNGTQTKLKYVPEQDTDFIFCTVGEEQGFLGSAIVLLLFMALILRLISLSERQPSRFVRVYGYCVLSIIFFHLFINVGMVLGLTPVIGIPLPLFSYGGSSLWGFTILLFVFLRMDAGRTLH
jgi:rod shape determining protein RodA